MASRSAIGAALCLLVSCGHAPPEERPDPPTAARTALDEAVARFHDTGSIELLRHWLDFYPDHEDAGVWREFVALRMYEAIVIGDLDAPPEPIREGEDPAVAPLPEPDVPQLIALAKAYPDTIAGQTALSLLEEEGLKRLSDPPVNPVLITFLEGGEEWVKAGEVRMPNVDLDAFRNRHEERLRDRFAVRLLDDGCATLMGYCNWWVEQYPDDHLTQEIRASMKAVWHKRGHPPWRSSHYATCAFRCAKQCRQSATPLDDTCFDPCFERCG